jgi:1-acyl-sn-glycerol-3-phosphate acyltransferase
MRPLYKFSWLLLQVLLKTLFGFRVYHADRVPLKGAVIVASNHISLADPPVVGAAIARELYYLGKKELFENRFLCAVVTAYNTIPVSRGRPDRAALRRIAQLLQEDQAVLLFPEGTRGPGDRLLPGKIGLGKLALDAGVDIVPARVSSSNCLRKTLSRRRRLTVRFGLPVEARWIREQGQGKTAYRRVVDEVMQRIDGLGRPATQDD